MRKQRLTFKSSKQKLQSEPPEFVGIIEVAEYLGCSKVTVDRMLAKKNKNKIPAHRVGKLWRFDLNEVSEWVKSGMGEL